MPFTKLFVVGNGFDIWHGIPSKYAHFKAFVKRHDRRLYNIIEDYLPAEDDWSDLEAALADVDVDSIIDDLGHFMPSYGAENWSDSGHHDFQYEVDQVVQHLSTILRTRFGEWIRTLVIPTPATATRRLRNIDANGIFLTFNYTSTLSSLYAVPDAHVLHIHGEAKLRDSELILGHSWNPARHRSLNEHANEDTDTRLMEANTILDGYFGRTFKPSEKLIREQRPFFEKLHGVKTVYVLGHSLSDVDAPYIDVLLKILSVAAAEWWVACRSPENKIEKKERLTELGVEARNIKTFLWDAEGDENVG